MSSGVILLQRPYVSFSSPLLLILRREITAVAVALLLNEFVLYCCKHDFLNPGTLRPFVTNHLGKVVYI